jgi:hypothetical protein
MSMVILGTLNVDSPDWVIAVGLGMSGVGFGIAGNGGSSNQAPAQDADPTSFNLTGTSYDRKSAAQSQPGSQPIAKKPVVDLTGV